MREVALAGLSRPLLLHEATPEALRAATANFERGRAADPFGLACWPAARVLAEALLERRPSASIVELGAGTGLVSLAAAAGGLRCVATDVSDEPLALLRASAAAQSLRVPTAVFDFTSDAPLPSPAPTLIVAADAIYNDELADACARRCAEAAGALVADSVGVYRARFESALTDTGLRWRSANTRLRWSAAALTARNADADGRREYDAEVEVYEIGSVSNFVR